MHEFSERRRATREKRNAFRRSDCSDSAHPAETVRRELEAHRELLEYLDSKTATTLEMIAIVSLLSPPG